MIKANTTVLRYDGVLYLSVSTLEELASKMRREEGWEAQLATIQQLIDKAREAERLMY